MGLQNWKKHKSVSYTANKIRYFDDIQQHWQKRFKKANLKQIELDVEHICKLNEQIEKLEQENRELKAYKDVNEDFKKAWDELNKKYKHLRSALEEIMEYCNYEHGSVYVIIDKINEVLNDTQDN